MQKSNYLAEKDIKTAYTSPANDQAKLQTRLEFLWQLAPFPHLGLWRFDSALNTEAREIAPFENEGV